MCDLETSLTKLNQTVTNRNWWDSNDKTCSTWRVTWKTVKLNRIKLAPTEQQRKCMKFKWQIYVQRDVWLNKTEFNWHQRICMKFKWQIYVQRDMWLGKQLNVLSRKQFIYTNSNWHRRTCMKFKFSVSRDCETVHVTHISLASFLWDVGKQW